MGTSVAGTTVRAEVGTTVGALGAIVGTTRGRFVSPSLDGATVGPTDGWVVSPTLDGATVEFVVGLAVGTKVESVG